MAIFTVGAGGTHATLQAAYDAIPEPLDQQYIIRLKKQEFAVVGFGINLTASARTTTPANNIVIEPEPGAGWADDPDAATNPYRYDAAKGAALRCQNNSAITFSGVVNHITIRGLQIIQESTINSNDIDLLKSTVSPDSTNRVLQDLILEVVGADVTSDVIALGGNSKIINCLVIHRGSNPTRGILLNENAAGQSIEVIGCTVVRPSNLTPLGVGIRNAFGNNTLTVVDTVIAGYLTDVESLDAGTDYNATDKDNPTSALPDTPNNVYSADPAATFMQASDVGGNHDFRLKAGSALLDAGIFDANWPLDAAGQPRGNPTDIGARELADEGPADSGARFMSPRGVFVEIPVDVAKVTNSPFRSDLIALNNARQATLIIQTSAPLSAGQWVLKGALTNDLSIGGQILATVNFPASPARIASQVVKVAHRLAYVEQVTPPTGGTVEKISVLLQ